MDSYTPTGGDPNPADEIPHTPSSLHFAACIMVKNEKKRLHVTLESIRNIANSLVVFDTGSTDNTIEILQNFSKESGIPLYLKEGVFVNFEVSRNELLEFADSFDFIDYLILLDVNDEFRGAESFRRLLEGMDSSELNKSSAILMPQEWWYGATRYYFNVKVVRARKGWRYKGVVHEHIYCPDVEEDAKPRMKIEDSNICFYQDRTQDDDKTGQRFHRDKILLYEESKRDPTNSRTIFYLAQTYACLGEHESAMHYFKKRLTMEGFEEEKYESYFQLGELSQVMGLPWIETLDWYLKAYQAIPRAEPLVAISVRYGTDDRIKNLSLAYMYAALACRLPFPSQCILFIDRAIYDHKRWSLLGIYSFYVGAMEEGYSGCLKAIEGGRICQIDSAVRLCDIKNLGFYIEALNSAINVNDPTLLSVYCRLRSQEFKILHPSKTDKEIMDMVDATVAILKVGKEVGKENQVQT